VAAIEIMAKAKEGGLTYISLYCVAFVSTARAGARLSHAETTNRPA
jgi:hypothetical protein